MKINSLREPKFITGTVAIVSSIVELIMNAFPPDMTLNEENVLRLFLISIMDLLGLFKSLLLS